MEQIKRIYQDIDYPDDGNFASSNYAENLILSLTAFPGMENWRILEPDFFDQATDAWRSVISFILLRRIEHALG